MHIHSKELKLFKSCVESIEDSLKNQSQVIEDIKVVCSAFSIATDRSGFVWELLKKAACVEGLQADYLTGETCKKAIRQLLLTCHPDKNLNKEIFRESRTIVSSIVILSKEIHTNMCQVDSDDAFSSFLKLLMGEGDSYLAWLNLSRDPQYLDLSKGLKIEKFKNLYFSYHEKVHGFKPISSGTYTRYNIPNSPEGLFFLGLTAEREEDITRFLLYFSIPISACYRDYFDIFSACKGNIKFNDNLRSREHVCQWYKEFLANFQELYTVLLEWHAIYDLLSSDQLDPHNVTVKPIIQKFSSSFRVREPSPRLYKIWRILINILLVITLIQPIYYLFRKEWLIHPRPPIPSKQFDIFKFFDDFKPNHNALMPINLLTQEDDGEYPSKVVDPTKALVHKLTRVNSDGWSGLHRLLRYQTSKAVVLYCLKVLDSEFLAHELTRVKSSSGWSGLQTVLRYQTKAVVLYCLKVLDSELLAHELTRMNSSGFSVLEILFHYQTKAVVLYCLEICLKFMGPKALAHELTRVDSSGWSAMHIVWRHQTSEAEVLFCLKVLDSKDLAHELARVNSSSGWSGLQTVLRNQTSKAVVLYCLKVLDSELLAHELTKVNSSSGWPALKLLLRYQTKAVVLHCLKIYLKFMGPKALAHELTRVNSSGWSGLGTVLRHQTSKTVVLHCLEIYLKFMGPKVLAHELTRMNSSGFSVLEILFHYQTKAVVLYCLEICLKFMGPKALAHELTRVDSSGWSAMHMVWRHQTSRAVVLRCSKILDSKVLAHELARVNSSNSWSGLHMLFCYQLSKAVVLLCLKDLPPNVVLADQLARTQLQLLITHRLGPHHPTSLQMILRQRHAMTSDTLVLKFRVLPGGELSLHMMFRRQTSEKMLLHCLEAIINPDILARELALMADDPKSGLRRFLSPSTLKQMVLRGRESSATPRHLEHNMSPKKSWVGCSMWSLRAPQTLSVNDNHSTNLNLNYGIVQK